MTARALSTAIVLLALPAMAQTGRPLPVQNEDAAIAIASKLCADQIKDTPVTPPSARKVGDQWRVIIWRTDEKIAAPSWWEVTFPMSGAISEVRCIYHYGINF
jgi:hypothetical protein